MSPLIARFMRDVTEVDARAVTPGISARERESLRVMRESFTYSLGAALLFDEGVSLDSVEACERRGANYLRSVEA